MMGTALRGTPPAGRGQPPSTCQQAVVSHAYLLACTTKEGRWVVAALHLDLQVEGIEGIDRAEDPRETLDYSYEKQLELLQKVRRGVADVATSRKRIELQLQGLSQKESTLEEQARAALAQGREDLAREALTRRSGLHQQIADLQGQLAQLQQQEEKLTVAAQQLQSKVESFRTRKETIKATYSAAEATTKINEAFAGISDELGDVGRPSSGPKTRPPKCSAGRCH